MAFDPNDYPTATTLNNVIITSTFTEANSRSPLVTGDTIGSLFGQIQKYLTDLQAISFSADPKDIGLGLVENKSSANIRSELTNSDVENAIGTTIASISDKQFVYTQGTESSSWVINHNLGKFVSVSLYDNDGNEIYGDINQVNNNSLIVSFSVAISGKAILN